MSDKSLFSADEWRAITDAPFLITVTMFAAGDHGPISMMKESAASARLLATPGNRGDASAIIAEIAPEAHSKEARHDASHTKGANLREVVTANVAELAAAATALQKLPGDEATQVGEWLVDIAKAVAGASKGVSDSEQHAIGEIAKVLGVDA